jgi:hypothetical protein
VAGRKKREGEGEITEAQENDYGTPEARRQAFFVVEQPDPQDRSTKRIRIEDNIEWYVKRSYLSRTQADALRKWQSDAYLSGIMPACIGSYAQQVTGGQSEISDMRLAAQSRRAHAIKFLSETGRYAVKLIDAVAVDMKPAGKYFMLEGYGSPNDGMILLYKCTEALAKHYGLTR